VQHAHNGLIVELGKPCYEQTDAPATTAQEAILKTVEPSEIDMAELAGEPVRATLTRAPGNGVLIRGLKMVTEDCWFAVRPSGTKDIFKIYAESLLGEDHLCRIQAEAQRFIARLFSLGSVLGE
jgi:phosphoglucomutase